MPVVQINTHKWDVERKRELVAKVTDAFVELGVPRELVIIHITEDDPENSAVGGVLMADLPPMPGA